MVKDTLSCFLCTSNLQMYVGRATVAEQRRLELTHLELIWQGAEFKRSLLQLLSDIPCYAGCCWGREGPALLSPLGLTPGEALPQPVGFPLYQFSHMES